MDFHINVFHENVDIYQRISHGCSRFYQETSFIVGRRLCWCPRSVITYDDYIVFILGKSRRYTPPVCLFVTICFQIPSSLFHTLKFMLEDAIDI